MEQIRKLHDVEDCGLLDRVAVLTLNNAHARETSALNETSLFELLEMAFYARGIDRGATAFLIALDQNAPYHNSHFSWFKQSRESFVYVDRIIVAATARGHGVARILYGDLIVEAQRAGQDRVVCEVNITPPNLASEAFHLKMGFTEVGQATIHDGTKTVRYFEKIIR